MEQFWTDALHNATSHLVLAGIDHGAVPDAVGIAKPLNNDIFKAI